MIFLANAMNLRIYRNDCELGAAAGQTAAIVLREKISLIRRVCVLTRVGHRV